MILHRLSLLRKGYNFSALFEGIVEGDFGAAFAGGGGVGFVVVDDAIFTVIDHLIVTLDVGGSACAVKLFGVIGIVVGFE